MKTLILRKDLTAKRLSYQLWLFFSKLKINSIYIDRISLTLNNNQEFILIEDINVDKTNKVIHPSAKKHPLLDLDLSFPKGKICAISSDLSKFN